MSDVHQERVLVVPTEAFCRLGYFQGFSSEADRYLDALLTAEYVQFRPRGEVESDPSFKQLIPYVVFLHKAPDGDQVFQYTRGKGMGEGRLHRKHSVGIGGHISADDVAEGTAAEDVYHEGLRRELEEEVQIMTPYTERRIGLINDDRTEVGSVHLGVVHLFEVEQPEVHPNETDLIECGFRPVAEILADMEGFESWSTISMQAIFTDTPPVLY